MYPQAILSLLVFAVFTTAHPAVSNPQGAVGATQIEDVRTQPLDKKPLHTTVLMSMATSTPSTGHELELR